MNGEASYGERKLAQAWYGSSHGMQIYREFERRYMELPRQLFVEIALTKSGIPVQRALDIGCGTGAGLSYMLMCLPYADITGIDPEPGMIAIAEKQLQGAAKIFSTSIEHYHAMPFDLVLSHSNLRLWTDPIIGLQRVQALLKPDGLAYILDLRRDISLAARKLSLSQFRDPEYQELYESQLRAAYTLDEVSQILESAKINSYSLSSRSILLTNNRMSSRNTRMQNILRMMQVKAFPSCFRESLIHLFIYA